MRKLWFLAVSTLFALPEASNAAVSMTLSLRPLPNAPNQDVSSAVVVLNGPNCGRLQSLGSCREQSLNYSSTILQIGSYDATRRTLYYTGQPTLPAHDGKTFTHYDHTSASYYQARADVNFELSPVRGSTPNTYSLFFDLVASERVENIKPDGFFYGSPDAFSELIMRSPTCCGRNYSPTLTPDGGLKFSFPDPGFRFEFASNVADRISAYITDLTFNFGEPLPIVQVSLPVDGKKCSFLECSQLAQASYNDFAGSLPDTFQSVASHAIDNNGDGHMVAFLSPGANGGSDQLVVSFAGTDSAGDLIRDFSLSGIYNQSFADYLGEASLFISELRSQYPNADFTLTGHSLGGAIASVLATASGLDAYTYNSPGTQNIVSTGQRLELTQILNSSGPLQSNGLGLSEYRHYGDLVSLIGQHEGSIHTVSGGQTLIDLAPASCVITCHGIGFLSDQLRNGVITEGLQAPIGSQTIVFPVNGNLQLASKIFNAYVDGWETFDPALPQSNFLRIDMLDSDALFDGMIFTSASNNNVDVFGLAGDEWTFLGAAAPYTVFNVGAYNSYLASNLTDFSDKNGNFAVSLHFSTPGFFAAEMSGFNHQDVTAAPEPTLWAMMLFGFAIIGYRIRNSNITYA